MSRPDEARLLCKPRAARYAFPDPELRGHLIRIPPSGAKSYTAVTRDPNGKQVWTTIGGADLMGVEQARTRAREIIMRVQEGKPAFEPKSQHLRRRWWPDLAGATSRTQWPARGQGNQPAA